jgi:hypothetical protein
MSQRGVAFPAPPFFFDRGEKTGREELLTWRKEPWSGGMITPQMEHAMEISTL